jgi:hypothetical protein
MKYHVLDKIDSAQELEDILNKLSEDKGTIVQVIVTENCSYTIVYTTE